MIKLRTEGPPGAMSFEPNFVFVCDSNTGSCTLMLTAPMMEVRMSEVSKSFL